MGAGGQDRGKGSSADGAEVIRARSRVPSSGFFAGYVVMSCHLDPDGRTSLIASALAMRAVPQIHQRSCQSLRPWRYVTPPSLCTLFLFLGVIFPHPYLPSELVRTLEDPSQVSLSLGHP